MPYVIFNPQTREYVSRHNNRAWVSDIQDAQIYYKSKFAMSLIHSKVSIARMQLENSDKFPTNAKDNLLKIWQDQYHRFNVATVLPARIVVDSDPNT